MTRIERLPFANYVDRRGATVVVFGGADDMYTWLRKYGGEMGLTVKAKLLESRLGRRYWQQPRRFVDVRPVAKAGEQARNLRA